MIAAQGVKVRLHRGEKIVLENRQFLGIMPLLPDDHKQDSETEGETRKLPRPDQGRSLEAVSDDFRRVLSADGTLDGDEDPLDHLREQFRSIEREAARAGYLYEQPIRLKTGGVEHDVVFDYGTGTVLKFTKPAKAAYVVNFDLGTPKMVPGMPLEYLERLMLQNEIFGDSLTFVGLGGDSNGRRIITRQNIVVGRAARWEEIIGLMVEELGFTKLRHNHGIGYDDSYAFVRDDAVVFDMRPANVFATEDGVIVPVDCIPVRLPPGKRRFFDK